MTITHCEIHHPRSILLKNNAFIPVPDNWPLSTNGWAVGTDFNLEIRAILEILERDSVLPWWNTGCSRHTVVKSELYIKALRPIEGEVLLIQLACNFPVHVSIAFLYKGIGTKHGWAVASSSASFSRSESIKSSISGLIQKLPLRKKYL